MRLKRWCAMEGMLAGDSNELPFGKILFNYLATIVPFWRLSDEPWLLANDSYLCGIGVLRNYGGDVLVIPLSGDVDKWDMLILAVHNREASFDAVRRIVVVDDRCVQFVEMILERLSPVPVIAWSNRERLAQYVIRDGHT